MTVNEQQIIAIGGGGFYRDGNNLALERYIIRHVWLLRVPEPANSPRRLIETGRLPSEAAPVPNIPPIRREAARPPAPTTPPGEPPR